MAFETYLKLLEEYIEKSKFSLKFGKNSIETTLVFFLVALFCPCQVRRKKGQNSKAAPEKLMKKAKTSVI